MERVSARLWFSGCKASLRELSFVRLGLDPEAMDHGISAQIRSFRIQNPNSEIKSL